MSFIGKILTKSQKDSVDIEDFLNTIDTETQEVEDADAYVKPMFLKADTDLKTIAKELKDGNTVLLNVSELIKRNPVRLKEQINKLKRFTDEIDGDMARISEEKMILTPARIKIVKRK